MEGNLPPVDIMSKIYMLACQLSGETRILNTVQSQIQRGNGDSRISTSSANEVQALLNELTIRLDCTFQLTAEQTVRLFQLIFIQFH